MNSHAWVITLLAVFVSGSVIAAARGWLRTYLRPGSERRLRPGRLFLCLAVAMLLGAGSRFLLEALLRANDAPASDSSQRVATLPVGPDGAQAGLPGGGYLHVPAGAVDKPTTIHVNSRSVSQQVAVDSPSGGPPLTFAPGSLSVYELTPIDTSLLRPVELALPIPAGQNVVVLVTANGETRTLAAVNTGETVRLSINNFDFNKPEAITVAR